MSFMPVWIIRTNEVVAARPCRGTAGRTGPPELAEVRNRDGADHVKGS